MLFSLLSVSYAASPPPVSNGNILPGPAQAIGEAAEESAQYYVAQKLLPGVSSAFTVVLFALGVVMIIVAGVFFVISSGDSENKDKAKNILLWTIVGIVVAVLSYALVRLVVGLDLVVS